MLVAEVGVDVDLPKMTSKGLSTSKLNSFALSKGLAPVQLLQKNSHTSPALHWPDTTKPLPNLGNPWLRTSALGTLSILTQY